MKMTSRKLLIINPNSSKSMTEGLDPLLIDMNRQGSTSTEIHTYTAPSGPPSINNEDDARETAGIVIKDIESQLSQYDAFLVACYSVHPLVGILRAKVAPHVHVTGIFEASISTSLSLLPMESEKKRSKFGIVSTGTYWEKALSDGVKDFLQVDDFKNCRRFKGVETTGLNASELHTAPPELVRRKMMEATKRLVKDRDVKIICLGCAGMAGLDSIVREALTEELGNDGRQVHILDGVKAGVALLEGLLRALPPQE
ncbi:Asp/Glu/hydantoin racemase [Amylocarpus encephaloides]|uniref:Asp/Glu/hydantoin racemase n=1 Tax=Amylocarpus encephaloides TaxID=45428 RepID=A0A9P7YGK2_9HELO|nr:Asp/Glu/hydantoin racemase [Amylocarpus encephaloides]